MTRGTSCDSHFLYPVSVTKETDVWQEKSEKLEGTDNSLTYTKTYTVKRAHCDWSKT